MACAWPAPSHYLNQCWNIVTWTLGNKLQWTLIEIYIFLSEKMRLKLSSWNWRPFCLGLNVLSKIDQLYITRSYCNKKPVTCINMPTGKIYKPVQKGEVVQFIKRNMQVNVAERCCRQVTSIRGFKTFLGNNSLREPMLTYRKISNIRRTKSPNLNVSRLVLQLSLPNPMKPGFKSRMKM